MTDPFVEDRLRSVKETAQRLALSSSGTLAAIHRGEIKAVRIGHRVLVPESEITRLIAAAS